jgi:hypothetical protein
MYGTYCRLNVCVFATDEEVLTALNKKLKPAVDAQSKQRQSKIRRAILKEHHDAQKLYQHYRF